MAIEEQVKRKGRSNDIDKHVGTRIRLRRTLLGMSQENLASEIGITFQQVQKYENGSNRVGASRLYHIANVMGVEIPFFFDGVESIASQYMKVAEKKPSFNAIPIDNKETVELVRAYYAIKDASVRKKMLEMLKTLAV